MRFKGQIEDMPQSNVYNRHIKIPKNLMDQWLDEGQHKRVIVILNDSYTIHCGFMPYGDGTYFINLNKVLCKKLNVDIGDELEISIVPDESKYGIPIPEEMEELLKQDEEGSLLFHKLTPGKQRSILHILGQPKSSNIRLRKSIVVLNYLKEVNGLLDFKELHEAFKSSNRN